MKKEEYLGKSGVRKLKALLSNAEFKKRINELRIKWGINKLVKSPEEEHQFWLALCNADKAEPDYYRKSSRRETRTERIVKDFEELCEFSQIYDSSRWIVMRHILLCIDLENMTEEQILSISPPNPMLRVKMLRNGDVVDSSHFCIDVTFASIDDVRAFWPTVLEWQNTILPVEIETGRLPNSLEDVKPGRPSVADEKLDIECARLRDEEHLEVKEIAYRMGFISSEQRHRLKRHRHTELRIERGRKLREK